MRILKVLLNLSIPAVLLLSAPAYHAADSVFPVDAQDDFKFMDLQRELRGAPDARRERELHFALGEYYFRKSMPDAATGHFRLFKPSEPLNTQDLLATVYLLRCALLTGDTPASTAYEKELTDALSSKSYFAAFRDKSVRSWDSPSGAHYRLLESVDRLEISLNDEPFYTISLS